MHSPAGHMNRDQLALETYRNSFAGPTRLAAGSVTLFDNTLRDGEQTPGVAFTTAEKVAIGRLLAETGIPALEAGFAAVSAEEREAIRAVVDAQTGMTVFSLCRCVEADVAAACACGVEHVTVYTPVSELQLRRRLQGDFTVVQDRIRRVVAAAKSRGLFVRFSCEEAFRTPPERLVSSYLTAKEVGADMLSLPDTVGVATPWAVERCLALLQREVGLPVSVHFHNDLGLSVANALAAMLAGATEVQVCANGLGERAGNTPLEQVALAALYQLDYDFGVNLEKLTELSTLVSKAAGTEPASNQPIFGAKSILSVEELATLFHFPNKSIETPHIFWLNAKRAPAPAQIPKEGLHLGKSVYRGIDRPVFISEDDRLRHIYIIGKTGVGKSELLTDMIMQDIRAGKGVCFIDPHDTVEKILEMIPPERAEDVIYFNPSDTDRPLGLNMIEAETEEEKHFITTSIIGLMYKLYDPHKTGIIGPRFEHAVRNAILTVMSEPGATFVEVVRVLTDARYLQELLPKVTDPIIRRYWTDQIAQTSDFHKSEVLDYIVSKFGRFVTNKMMRNIIGQSDSAFNFRRVMDEGKILLINLAKGRIGEENSQFLGLILVPKLLIGAMSRQDIPEDKRRPFYIYVDEFQNFATPDFAQILSEARKFGLSLTVANQFIGQMEEEVKNAIFGNVGTIMSFRVGVTDASYLQHEYQPTFSETDLINVERFNVYIKTIVNNETVPPFSMDLTKDMGKLKEMRSQKMAEMVKQLSRLKYGRDKNVVEAEISQRAKL